MANQERAKEEEGRGLSTIRSGHQSGQLKYTDPNQPKPAKVPIFSSGFTGDKQPALLSVNDSAFFFAQTRTKPSKKSTKKTTPKMRILLASNRPIVEATGCSALRRVWMVVFVVLTVVSVSTWRSP